MSCTVKRLKMNEWLSAAGSFHDYHYTHYWAYGEKAAERLGATSEHVAVRNSVGETVGLANVRVKRVPFRLGGIAYISGGPMVDRGGESFRHVLPPVLNAISREYAENQGLILRISLRHKTNERQDAEKDIYEQLNYSLVGETNATSILDLCGSPEKIRKDFHQKWRNLLNKSEKQGLVIRAGEKLELFKHFSTLFSELISRKAFKVDMDDEFFGKVQSQSPLQERFYIAIAYRENKPVAGHLSSMTGDTSVYLLGAANEEGRKTGAAYLLQWHVINAARERGCRWYDLGGIDKDNNPDVFRFKERMGGELVGTGKVFELGYGVKGRMTHLAETIYRFLR